MARRTNSGQFKLWWNRASQTPREGSVDSGNGRKPSDSESTKRPVSESHTGYGIGRLKVEGHALGRSRS